ncbi:MAG: acetyltransferase [Kiritimatiellae bacterium]|nr:acetyltransferase [Kiritimatiellia bacterium]
MAKELLIIGASGFGREAAWIAARAGMTVAGFCDDAPERASEQKNGAPFLGPVEAAAATHPGAAFFVAVGSNRARKELSARAAAAGLSPVSIIDPTAVVAPGAVVGAGCFVGAYAVVSCGARLGEGVIVNHQATVGHDAEIAGFCQLCPGARVSGACVLEEGALLGSNAAVSPLKRVGEWATIGPGAAALADVPAGQTLVKLARREKP